MNSKFNTFLLIVIIIILVTGIYLFQKKSQTNTPDDSNTVISFDNDNTDTSADEIGSDITPVSQERMSNDPHIQATLSGITTTPANFAGHYVVVYIGCGTGCANPAIYDKNNGKLYSIDSLVLAGAVTNEDIVIIYSSANSDVLTIPKYNVGGTYGAQYRLVGTRLVQVQ